MMAIKKLLIAFLLFSTTITAYGADNFIVNSIKIEGLDQISIDSILMDLSINPGDIVNSNDIKDKIRSFFSTGFIDDIKIFRDGNTLIFRIKETPIVYRIYFYGNKLIPTKNLKKIMDPSDFSDSSNDSDDDSSDDDSSNDDSSNDDSSNDYSSNDYSSDDDISNDDISNDDISDDDSSNDYSSDSNDSHFIIVEELLNRNKLFKIKQEIDNLYYTQGRYNNVTKIVTTPLPDHHIDLIYIFQEHIPAKIQQINILGNKKFSNIQLLSQFNLYDRSSWRYMLGSCSFDKNELLHDIDTLQNFYFDHGYVNFHINDVQIHLTPDKKRIYLSINVNEGEQYKINDLILDGNIMNCIVDIRPLIKLPLGTLYNASQIDEIKTNIKNFINQYGYLNPHITTNIKINDIDKSVNVYMNVDFGYRYQVRKIYFEGNKISQERILRSEMRQIEYSWFNSKLVTQGKERLNRTGNFENIDIIIRPVSNIPDKVDLIYLIKERNAGVINFGLGYGTDIGLNFHSNLMNSNWFGSKYIKFESIRNITQNYYDFSMNDPYFTIDGVNVGGRIFYNALKPITHSLSNYATKNYGISGSLGLPIGENKLLHFGLEYEHHYFDDISAQISMWNYFDSMDFAQSFKNKNYFFANDYNFSYSWKSNNLDRGFFPNNGYIVKLTGKISMPISQNKFHKNTLDIKKYLPLDKKRTWILSTHSILSYGDGFRGKQLPFYENFYAGGINTIRGFLNNSIGPKAVYVKKKSEKNFCRFCSSDDTIGGNCSIIGNLELFIPLSFMPAQQNNFLRTSIFLDTASVWNNHWKQTKEMEHSDIVDFSDKKKIRISTGISMQWISPFGPMVFSYSYPIKKYDGDRIEQFQFSMGNLL